MKLFDLVYIIDNSLIDLLYGWEVHIRFEIKNGYSEYGYLLRKDRPCLRSRLAKEIPNGIIRQVTAKESDLWKGEIYIWIDSDCEAT